MAKNIFDRNLFPVQKKHEREVNIFPEKNKLLVFHYDC